MKEKPFPDPESRNFISCPYCTIRIPAEVPECPNCRQSVTGGTSGTPKEFRDLLVRTYSNALIAYKNESVDYRPFKMQPGETDVTVRTQIHQPGARQPITLDYSLEKNGNAWKVYDVVVAGVSLVTNYRSNFTTEVRNGGIDGLIKTLQTKNRSLEAATKK